MAGLLRACFFMESEASFWINLPPELPEADDLKAIMALPPIVKRVPSSSSLTKMMRDFAQEEN
jgi:hypothetical protein